MFKKFLHSIVAIPWVYDAFQIFLGTRRNQQRIIKQIYPINENALILDIGGGTGLFRNIWPTTCKYVCLDNDIIKLQGFLNKYPIGNVLLADATNIPIQNNSVDFVLSSSMSHHVSEEVLIHLIQESMRVLKESGKFVFLDAILKPESWKNKLLWKFDRGLYPHTEKTLYSLISSQCTIVHWEKFSNTYDYVLAIGTKNKFF